MLGDSISVSDLLKLIGSDKAPVILDVRREALFAKAPFVLPAARRPSAPLPQPTELGDTPHGIVVYCAHGHNLSQMAAAHLRSLGAPAAWLEGGIDAWAAANGPLIAREPDAPARFGAGTVWVTRRRPKIDRVACPWFIRRFIDDRARFLFVDGPYVIKIADEMGGIAFDVEGASVTHDGPRCSFDTLMDRYQVNDPDLRRLAEIVRGADTADLGLARETGGLLSISLGLSILENDDRQMLHRGFHLYDGLYAYLRFASTERHNWPPKT